MKKIILSAITCCALVILSACSSADGFKAATLGAGVKAGQDYVTGLSPSAAARQYFSRIGNKAPIETLTKANAARSKSGVRFVANDGILIPPGVTIQFTNKGYCLDPKLPAPVADEEYQLVPVSALIPTELQGIYTNLVRKAAAGDTNVKTNMQRLVWALRTAGTDASYANNLSATQKSILDSCSSRPGEFESVHSGAKSTSMLMDKMWSLADSIGGVKIGGRTYRASDFRSVASMENAVGSHLNNLLLQGKNLPIQRTGFNFGELQPGIYTDVRGAGSLAFTAKIANATNQNFIFYPANYVGQVGSGSALSALASSNNTRRQRVSMGPIDEVKVIEDVEPAWGDMDDFKSLPCPEKKKLFNMALLAEYAYLDSDSDSLKQLVGQGFYNIQTLPNPAGMSIVVMGNKNDNNLYIAFAGTKGGSSVADIHDNIDIATSDKNPARFGVAKRYVESIMNEYPGKNVCIVGHSLGGSTVQYVLGAISSNKLQGYTINPYALPGTNGIIEDPRLVDVVHEDDIAQRVHPDYARRIGRGVYIQNPWYKEAVRQAQEVVGQAILGPAGPALMEIKYEINQHSLKSTLKDMQSLMKGCN